MKIKRFNEFINEDSSVLLAPNGKPSNLNEFQYNQVRTPEFIEWFGDWINNPIEASKLLDENGEPIIMYHGTTNKFDTFKYSKKTRQSYYCDGFYFSNNLKKVYDYGDNIFECYLSIKKPFIMNNSTLKLADKYGGTNNYEEFKNDVEQYCKYTIGYRSENSIFKENIIKDGYDGLIIEEFGINIVFSPTQIKSATDNNGKFDKNNPNINE